jgi:FkbM family methyltransferase
MSSVEDDAVRWAKRLLPRQIRLAAREAYRALRPRFGPFESWSQSGEDMVLRDRFRESTGFYVDVGAYHPRYASNTYHFYKRGWRGISIEPNPAAIARFRRWRPRDINLGVGIGTATGAQSFYVFEEDELSTFDEAAARERERHHRIERTEQIAIRSLADVLAQHAPGPIDFLSVDCEGRDYDVITSNDWKRFRPRVVVVEMLDELARSTPIAKIADHRIAAFLVEHRYRAFAAVAFNVFFERVD